MRTIGQPVVYETLARLGIVYEELAHSPAFTVEDMEAIPFPPDVAIAKNLFLRDAKGRRHFLAVYHKDREVNLRRLQETLPCSRLSFGSDERLARYLGLTKGSVSPFGILNDNERAVEVILDRQLLARPRIGVHPNDNAATLLLPPADVVRVIEEHGNSIRYL